MNRRAFATSSLLVKNSVLNFMGMAIPLLIGFFAIPFTVKGLGAEQFGILSIVLVILSYLAMMDFGLSRATTKLTAQLLREQQDQDISSLIWTSLLLCIGLGCLGALLLYRLSPWLVHGIFNIAPELKTTAVSVIRLMSIGVPFLIATINLKGILGAAQRFDLVNALQIPINTLSFLIPALSYFIGMSLTQIVLIIVLLRAAGAVIYLLFCLKVYPASTRHPRFDKKHLRPLFTFGGWVTITGVINPLLVYIDRLFIGSLLSMTSLTYYTAPVEGITRLRVIPTAIMNTLFPEFGKSRLDADQGHIQTLLSRAVKYIFIPTGLAGLLLFFYAEDLLTIWLGAEFAVHSATVFKIVAVSMVINSLALVPFTFLQGIGRPDIPARFHMLELIIYIPLIWLGIRFFGLTGAAAAWSLRVLVDAVLLYTTTFRQTSALWTQLKDCHIRGVLFILLGLGAAMLVLQQIFFSPVWRILPLLVLGPLTLMALWRLTFSDSEKARIISFLPGTK